MNDHDRDDELVRAALDARTPLAPDPTDELDRLRPRYLRARRRRRMTIAGSSIAASVVVLGGGAALFSLVDDGTERIETIPPAVTVGVDPTTTTEASTTTTTVAETTTTTETTPPSAPDAPTATSEATRSPQPDAPTQTSVPDGGPATTEPDPTIPAPTSTAPDATTPPSTTAPPTPTTAPPAPQPDSRNNEGGTVDVLFDGVTVQLVSAVANPGFVADIRESGGSRVDVRFEPEDSSGSPWRIRADVEGGRLVWDVD